MSLEELSYSQCIVFLTECTFSALHLVGHLITHYSKTVNTGFYIATRAARYEENMRYAITLLNVAIMILFAINKQILKCTQCCLSAAIMLLKYSTVLVD